MATKKKEVSIFDCEVCGAQSQFPPGTKSKDKHCAACAVEADRKAMRDGTYVVPDGVDRVVHATAESGVQISEKPEEEE